MDATAGTTYNCIKQAAFNTLLAYPEAKPESGSVSNQAGKIANTAIVLQCHLRKLAVNEGCEELFRKCMEELANDPENSERLQQMVLTVKKGWGNQAKATRTGASAAAPHRLPHSMTTFTEQFASLSQDSELSTDSTGMPTWNFIPNYAATAVTKTPAGTTTPAAPTDPKRKPAAAMKATKKRVLEGLHILQILGSKCARVLNSSRRRSS